MVLAHLFLFVHLFLSFFVICYLLEQDESIEVAFGHIFLLFRQLTHDHMI